MATPNSTFDRTVRWIGNLDHPLYDDERQRHIWYEASAIAFQASLFGVLAVAAGAVWIGGREAIPYTVAFITVSYINLFIFSAYTRSKRTGYLPARSDALRPRTLISLGLAVLYFAGVARNLEWAAAWIVSFAAILGFGVAAAVLAGNRRGRNLDGDEELG